MNHLEHVRDIGSAELFELAKEAILTWQLQECAGVIARPQRRVHPGMIVDLWLNPFWPTSPRRSRGEDVLIPVGSCVVEDVIDTARQAGFVYRTLPGHLETGVQTFLVSIDDGASSDDDAESRGGDGGSGGAEGGGDAESGGVAEGSGRLIASITSRSSPGHPLLTAFAPLSAATQKMMAARYAAGLERLLRNATR